MKKLFQVLTIVIGLSAIVQTIDKTLPYFRMMQTKKSAGVISMPTDNHISNE